MQYVLIAFLCVCDVAVVLLNGLSIFFLKVGVATNHGIRHILLYQ